MSIEAATSILKNLNDLYEDVDGMDLSRRARETIVTDDRSFTYGEIVFEEFAKMLEVAEPRSGETFYDLGAGTGKAVLAAALLYDWKKCTGIDLLPTLHACSVSLLEKLNQSLDSPVYLKRLANVAFIEADLTQSDFSDADVIFTHATCFASELWDPLLEKFNQLKTGTRLIVVTKRLPDSGFQLIKETNQPFTWGNATVSIYRKV